MPVHEDQAVVGLAGHAQGMHAVFSGIYLQAGGFDQGHGNLAVDGLVFRQQHPDVCELGTQLLFGTTGHALHSATDLRVLAQPGRKPEGTALARHAVRTDLAAHELGQLARDGQTQTGASVFAGGGVVGLLEGIEQALHHIGLDADAGVRYLKAQEHGVCILSLLGQPQVHAAGVGELDRVGGVVQQRLLQPGRVAQQVHRRQVDVAGQRQPTHTRPLLEHGHHVADNALQGHRHLFQRKLAGLDLGQVQHRIHNAQQMLAGVFQLVQAVELGGAQPAPADQVGHAGDGIQGGADFVAHVGQESALGQVGRLGCPPGFFELGRALADHVFQVLAVAGEFGLGAQPFGHVAVDALHGADPALCIQHGRGIGFQRAVAAIGMAPAQQQIPPAAALLERLDKPGLEHGPVVRVHQVQRVRGH
jgi:hypothetical protein